LFACAFMLGAMMLSTFQQPTYAAPGVCLLFVLIAQSLRRLSRWRPARRPVGVWLAAALTLLYLCDSAWAAVAELEQARERWGLERVRLLRAGEHPRGQHLILVRYTGQHPSHMEWVYNGADIDGARVVWARERDADQNRQLLDSFATRRAWLLEP